MRVGPCLSSQFLTAECFQWLGLPGQLPESAMSAHQRYAEEVPVPRCLTARSSSCQRCSDGRCSS